MVMRRFIKAFAILVLLAIQLGVAHHRRKNHDPVFPRFVFENVDDRIARILVLIILEGDPRRVGSRQIDGHDV